MIKLPTLDTTGELLVETVAIILHSPTTTGTDCRGTDPIQF